MDVRPVTADQAATLAFEPEAFEARYGWRLVEGWAAPGGLVATVEALEAGVDPVWLAHVVVDDRAREVVGMGGFTGPPADGEVEIGYHVAPSRRGRGVGTAALGLWLARARAAAVTRVVARTAPGRHASARMLARCGFVRDPDRARDDPHRWWVLTLPPG